MIIVNQDKNLFKTVYDVKDINTYQEEDYHFYTDEKGYKMAKLVKGDYVICIKNKVFARYKTQNDLYLVLEQLDQSFNNNVLMFKLPCSSVIRNNKMVAGYDN